MLVLAFFLITVLAPLFVLCTKALFGGILATEARTVLEASATCAFRCLSLARLGDGIDESDMSEFRTSLAREVLANAASGPLAGCVMDVEAELVSEGTVACRMRYRPGRLDSGLFAEPLPDAAIVHCRVDLLVEP